MVKKHNSEKLNTHKHGEKIHKPTHESEHKHKDVHKHGVVEKEEEPISLPVKDYCSKKSGLIDSNVINVLLVLVVMILIFNVFTIGTIKSIIATSSVDLKSTQDYSNAPEFNASKEKALDENTPVSTGDAVQDAINAVIPTGSAGLYGEKLGISFDDVKGGLEVLAKLESSISYNDLSESQKERYVKIGTTPYTACEFCCGIGPKGFGTADGKIACGCAHNLAFSGLTKYIILNFGDDYTDEEIFDNIQKWKSLFFPKQMVQRYLELQKTGDDFGSLEALPGMVGGC